MFKITFKGKVTGEIALEQELSLLSAASREALPLNHKCGGHARCGTCIVTVEEGQDRLTPMGGAETRILKILKAQPDQRLACQAWAQGDVACRVD